MLEPSLLLLRHKGVCYEGESMIGNAMAVLWTAASMATATGTVTVDVASSGHRLDPSPMNGTVLPIWYTPEKVAALAEGLRRGGFQLFRYPNGTLSNEYHWNGRGSYDSLGIWHPSADSFSPGFKVNTLHRGTSRSNYGSVFPSQLFDADTASFWWGVAEKDSLQPWLEVDFGSAIEVDSLEILWGAVRPDSIELSALASDMGNNVLWANPVHWDAGVAVPVTESVTQARLAPTLTAEWFRLRCLGRGLGAQMREIRLYRNGALVSGNSASAPPMAVGYGTHPSNAPTSDATPRWDFDTFMATLAREFPGSEPLLCVNVGTGTPEEAAAWVHYANLVKRYGVKRWHVGNEIDGNWEQGGALDAGQYAVRFVAFAKAMKAVDSTIEIYGPVLSGMDWQSRPSGRDSLDWMESFLSRIGAAERRDGRRYLDGVDFHAYPYGISSGSGTPALMLKAMDGLGKALDTLDAYMQRHLDGASSRKVAITEFNASVNISYLLMHEVNGIGVADMLGQLASRFGDRAVTCLWEPEGGEPSNPDGSSGASYGSLRLFTPGARGLTSDLGDPPTGAFWGQYLVTQGWLERGRTGDGGAPSLLASTVTGNANLRAFAAKDSGRVSVLVLNLAAKADSVSLDLRAAADSGELLTWSSQHYAWDGTTSMARALPNLGPTASLWKGGKAAIPAYGALIFRAGAAPMATGKLEMLLRTQSATELREGDTLVLTAYLRQKGGHLVSGAYWNDSSCAAAPCSDALATPLSSFDGAWDGSLEGSVLRIPGLAIGNHVLRFAWTGSNGAVLRDSVSVRVTGTPRASRWIDRFDAGTLRCDLPGTPRWFSMVQAGAPASKISLTEPTWPDTTQNKRWFQMAFTLNQPTTLSYPNFAMASLSIPRTFLDSTSSRWVGIVFDHSAAYDSGTGVFQLQVPEDSVTDYDYHMVTLSATAGKWVRDTLYWSDFHQGGWGKTEGTLDVRQIQELQFRAAGAGRGTLRLDNLALLGTEGESLPLSVKRTSMLPAWQVLQRNGTLMVETPIGAKKASVRLMDAFGRELFRSEGNGVVGIPVGRSGIAFLALEADGKREVRKINLIR